MIFTQARLEGLWLIELEPKSDARGFLIRTYCEQQFSQRGLNVEWKQAIHSYSALPGTLRGLHFQHGVHAETKLIRCARGVVYDVVIDLRPRSPTQFQWFAVELRSDRPMLLYVPRGFAHGFLTLTHDVEMEYMFSTPHAPEAQRGVRYDDPYFAVAWPGKVKVISPQDTSWPDFDPSRSDDLVGL